MAAAPGRFGRPVPAGRPPRPVRARPACAAGAGGTPLALPEASPGAVAARGTAPARLLLLWDPTRIGLGLLVVALAAGGVAGYGWWQNWPSTLYDAARKDFEQGQVALHAGRRDEARRHYEAAEQRLAQLVRAD